ncbi:MAG: acetyl-CoA carboxylase carboxyl transferase subunit beta [Burkholderiales bacterium]|jgi:acetyl-CoA carboxylase carboxyl transferase subunit beta|nr:acetyl-CoA carboxylase carboxyl transferase subunit beta [Burkholderiales bacterium]
MSWLSKILPPKVQASSNKMNVPEGLWCKCDNCNEILYHTDLDNNLKVCPKCDHHHPLTARERIGMLLNDEDQVEIGSEVQTVDILKFEDTRRYTDRLATSREKIGEDEALVVMQGMLNDQMVVVACFEFRFIGGSMGSVVGERFVRGIKAAVENDCPFICVAASGGARMQEGVSSLMQMAKTCAALNLLSKHRLPFISVLSYPTMGGVSASFAFLGDAVIAEPGALIGFAGSRVIEQTVREKLPEGFQTAEFLLDKGALDMVTHRRDLKQTISNILALLLNKDIG